jgi:hypothetical protein
MNNNEVLVLLRKVKAYCPAQAIDKYTPEAWAEALGDVAFDSANEALVRICKQPLEVGRSRFIEPGHLIGEVRRIERERLAAYGTPIPPEHIIEPADYSAWMRHAVRAIADGTVKPGQPVPPMPPELLP